MQLSLEQIRAVALGVETVSEEADGIHLHRFTAEERALYENTVFATKTRATAGVRLEFLTDATALSLMVRVQEGSTRKYFSHDVYLDEKRIGSLCNFTEESKAALYPLGDFPLGDFEARFYFGNVGSENGEHCVKILFPALCDSVLRELSLENATYLRPVKKNKTVLMYGDSITQGYDALFASHSYAARMTAFFEDAEVFNKAIAGDVFRPALAAAGVDRTPEIITVAYGTNDWNRLTKAEFDANAKAFLDTLSQRYPAAKIFVITPIWRAEWEEKRVFGAFASVGETLQRLCAEKENRICICGWDFIPEDPSYFGDKRLHPNDEGFVSYTVNLQKAMKPYC